jgi:NADH dehydrogenase
MAGTITVFGGTGFIGRHLVALLLRTGKTVRMAVRHPGRVKTPVEATNSPEIVQADMLDDTSLGSAIMGADAVFNLVGILTIRPHGPIAPSTSKALAELLWQHKIMGSCA